MRCQKKPGGRLAARCDSFVVETDVHWPTDVNLLRDAIRCLVRARHRGLASAPAPVRKGA